VSNARWAALRELSLERWRHWYREPGTIFWSFGFPLLLSMVLGMAFRNQAPERMHALIEAGADAERVRGLLAQSADLSVRVADAKSARDELRTGKASLVVVPGPQVTYRFDPTRPESRLARALVDDALQRGEGRADAVKVATEHVTEPGSRYIDFLIPGLLGLGLMSSGLWGVGFSLVQMRARKVLKRLVATPMKKSDFMAAFVTVPALLSLAQIPPLLLFAHFAFGVMVAGSVVALAVVTTLGALTFTGMGLLFASRSHNPQIVSGLINVATFPAYLCSGVFFSSSRFPEWLWPVIKLLPLTALVDALRAIMVDGTGLIGLVFPITVLAGWGSVSFWGAHRLFRWQ